MVFISLNDMSRWQYARVRCGTAVGLGFAVAFTVGALVAAGVPVLPVPVLDPAHAATSMAAQSPTTRTVNLRNDFILCSPLSGNSTTCYIAPKLGENESRLIGSALHPHR